MNEVTSRDRSDTLDGVLKTLSVDIHILLKCYCFKLFLVKQGNLLLAMQKCNNYL